MSNLLGIETNYFTDTKIKVKAGMQFNKKQDYKIRTIGYDIFRHYFDNDKKDCQVGSIRLKRVLKY
jgi:hypothetical protein